MRKSLTQCLQLFDRSIYIALTFEFGHVTVLLKKAIFDKVYNIEIEPAIVCTVDLHQAWSILPALELLPSSRRTVEVEQTPMQAKRIKLDLPLTYGEIFRFVFKSEDIDKCLTTYKMPCVSQLSNKSGTDIIANLKNKKTNQYHHNQNNL